ncbi:hypothetical protein [Pleurocapsa sp. PCC 7319]|uniref:hypothetical protein n=1 Tax=Pleurocapsa sp. PCC 7319 TaxID=118161 RepID=UPI00034CCDE5|nr:hypothetical protein [Pleurocapsa sp. PCC 7319]
MSIEEFVELTQQQIKSYPLALKALWFDYHDDWHKSHKLIDTRSDRDCAWVHAYLHRKEGDLSNARYWYRRSGKPESKLSLTKYLEGRKPLASDMGLARTRFSDCAFDWLYIPLF